ncbi:MAG: hypothetical protein HYV63_05485 [Candidatus Schekmanbacteria bacterium]|nr:hypothetical protein [Candidatus Schekmanbacteria bacterium]
MWDKLLTLATTVAVIEVSAFLGSTQARWQHVGWKTWPLDGPGGDPAARNLAWRHLWRALDALHAVGYRRQAQRLLYLCYSGKVHVAPEMEGDLAACVLNGGLSLVADHGRIYVSEVTMKGRYESASPLDRVARAKSWFYIASVLLHELSHFDSGSTNEGPAYAAERDFLLACARYWAAKTAGVERAAHLQALDELREELSIAVPRAGLPWEPLPPFRAD